MIQRILVVIVFILVSKLQFAQTFEEIKDEQIDFTELLDRMALFIGDDFDSLDVEIFASGPVVASVIMKDVDHLPTYGELYKELLDIKDKGFLIDIREAKLAESILKERPADISNWHEDRLLFEKMKIDSSEINKIFNYLKEHSNPSLTYEDVMVGFREMKQQENAAIKARQEEVIRKNLDAHSVFKEDQYLKLSADKNKPLLLFFTGYMCVNAEKMKHNVILDADIVPILEEDFLLVTLYVDDQTELPEAEQTTIEFDGRIKKIETIGDAHTYYQMSKFNISMQPYFVVLSASGEIIETTSYRECRDSPVKFKAFLEKSLQEFHQN